MNQKQTKKNFIFLFIAGAVIAIPLATAGTAFAADGAGLKGGFQHIFGNRPAITLFQHKESGDKGVMGTIASITGSTLSLTAKNSTVYAVDTTGAKIYKGFGKSTTTLTVADLKSGDSIIVFGTVGSTTIQAKYIIDAPQFPDMMKGQKQKKAPAVSGKITSVNGSTFTVDVRGRGKNATTTSFTVNTTSSTTITEKGKGTSTAELTVGKFVSVSGIIDTIQKTITAAKIRIINGFHGGFWKHGK